MLALLGYIFSVFIGISLGLIGSGGSILAVPILVYLFNISPEIATTHSLFVVGITSAIASYGYFRKGGYDLQTAWFFGLPSVIILLLTRKFVLPALPEIILHWNHFMLDKQMFIITLFAVLMLGASYSMIKEHRENPPAKTSGGLLAVIGVIVGFIIGILGAGGGFLIIPTLVVFGKLSMKAAIATSLLIITSNSLIGFAGDLINRVPLNYFILFTVSASAISGMFIGLFLKKKINGKILKPAFGWFVLVMGIFILVKEFFL